MAVPLTAGTSVDVGAPTPLFDARFSAGNFATFEYDVTANGQRFLVLAPLSQARSTPITVVLNWTAALNRK